LINAGKSKKTFLKPQKNYCCLRIFLLNLIFLNKTLWQFRLLKYSYFCHNKKPF